MTAENYANEQKLVEQLINSRDRIRAELSKTIVGQREVIDEILIALFAGGHCLITGAPGLAKTLLVNPPLVLGYIFVEHTPARTHLTVRDLAFFQKLHQKWA